MPEFSTPLRVTWDLPVGPTVASAHWDALVAARVLFVEIAADQSTLNGLDGIAPGLAAPGAPQVTLAAGATAARGALGFLPPPSVARTDLLVLPPHPDPSEAERITGFRSITWAVWSTGTGLEVLPSALAACRRLGGGTVAVLNPPAPASPLTHEDRKRAVDMWRREGDSEIALRVHDLFLAQDLGLEPFREYAGCQAGDGLGHLAADGTLTACRTLPVELGNLGTQGLRAIWADEPRRELCRKLAEAPAACTGCAVAGSCRGGCRGLVAVGAGGSDLSAPDPSCAGPMMDTGKGAA